MLPLAMGTEKTKTIAVRVPLRVAEAIAADAEFTNESPGQFLRGMLEKRYSSESSARKTNGLGRKSITDGPELTFREVDDDE